MNTDINIQNVDYSKDALCWILPYLESLRGSTVSQAYLALHKTLHEVLEKKIFFGTLRHF
jgi:hypothetical protein